GDDDDKKPKLDNENPESSDDKPAVPKDDTPTRKDDDQQAEQNGDKQEQPKTLEQLEKEREELLNQEVALVNKLNEQLYDDRGNIVSPQKQRALLDSPLMAELLQISKQQQDLDKKIEELEGENNTPPRTIEQIAESGVPLSARLLFPEYLPGGEHYADPQGSDEARRRCPSPGSSWGFGSLGKWQNPNADQKNKSPQTEKPGDSNNTDNCPQPATNNLGEDQENESAEHADPAVPTTSQKKEGKTSENQGKSSKDSLGSRGREDDSSSARRGRRSRKTNPLVDNRTNSPNGDDDPKGDNEKVKNAGDEPAQEDAGEQAEQKVDNEKPASSVVVAGGHVIDIPDSLLIDLPANRLTLTELFKTVPEQSDTMGESGIAPAGADGSKADSEAVEDQAKKTYSVSRDRESRSTRNRQVQHSYQVRPLMEQVIDQVFATNNFYDDLSGVNDNNFAIAAPIAGNNNADQEKEPAIEDNATQEKADPENAQPDNNDDQPADEEDPQNIEEDICGLSSAEWEVRNDSTEALKSSTAAAIPYLVDTLEETHDREVRWRARVVLETLYQKLTDIHICNNRYINVKGKLPSHMIKDAIITVATKTPGQDHFEDQTHRAYEPITVSEDGSFTVRGNFNDGVSEPAEAIVIFVNGEEWLEVDPLQTTHPGADCDELSVDLGQRDRRRGR
ncbi:MAG: hypothetical protein VB857_12890, partial [Pirellulaceae bacterium]